eukprot:4437530-Prymnesium_polylepis.1
MSLQGIHVLRTLPSHSLIQRRGAGGVRAACARGGQLHRHARLLWCCCRVRKVRRSLCVAEGDLLKGASGARDCLFDWALSEGWVVRLLTHIQAHAHADQPSPRAEGLERPAALAAALEQ